MGQLIHVIPETDFTFDGRTSTEQLVVLAERIDARLIATGALIVRFHTKGSWSGSSCKAEIRVHNMSFAEEEPHTLFAESGASSRALATLANTDTAPRLYVTAFTGPIAAELRVVLAWVQGAVASTSSNTFSCAVDIVGRE